MFSSKPKTRQHWEKQTLAQHNIDFENHKGQGNMTSMGKLTFWVYKVFASNFIL